MKIDKQERCRIGGEFSDGFDADFFCFQRCHGAGKYRFG